MVKKLLERFTKKNCKSQIKKHFRIDKVIKGKETSYMSNGQVMIIRLIVGLIKKLLYSWYIKLS